MSKRYVRSSFMNTGIKNPFIFLIGSTIITLIGAFFVMRWIIDFVSMFI